MTERLRITSIELGATIKGKPTVELYGDTRLDYPVLRLFDPGQLIGIGIDPGSLSQEKMPVALWAYYEVSSKMNQHGRPYKDVIALEQINAPATATSVDTSAILGELRAIKALLLQLTRQQPDHAEPVEPRRRFFRPNSQPAEHLRTLAHAGTGDPLACPHCGSDFRHPNPECPNHATRQSTPVTPPAEEPETSSQPTDHRAEFYRLGADAMAAGTISHTDFNACVATANGEGYEGALAALKQKLA